MSLYREHFGFNATQVLLPRLDTESIDQYRHHQLGTVGVSAIERSPARFRLIGDRLKRQRGISALDDQSLRRAEQRRIQLTIAWATHSG
nr:hypothetical protein [Nocardia cyriacigeorgica]